MCRYFNIVSNWTVSELLNCKFVNKAEIQLTGKSHYIYYIYTYFFCLFSIVFPRTAYIFVFFFAALSLLEECLCRRFFSAFLSFILFGCSPNRRHNKYANIVGAYILRFARLKFICALNVTLKSRLSIKRGNNSAG